MDIQELIIRIQREGVGPLAKDITKLEDATEYIYAIYGYLNFGGRNTNEEEWVWQNILRAKAILEEEDV